MLSVGLPASRGVTFALLSVCNHVSLEDVMVFGWHRWRCTYDEDPQVLLLCVSTIPFLFPSALSWPSLSVTSVSDREDLFFQNTNQHQNFSKCSSVEKKKICLCFILVCAFYVRYRESLKKFYSFLPSGDLKFGSTTLYIRGPWLSLILT